MKRVQLGNMTIANLVERFAQIGVAQGKALLRGENAKFNRLFDQMGDVSRELKRRDGDQRRALMALYNYQDMQVRMKAAIHTLAVAPVEARRMLQTIADSNWMPQAGHAGMSLSNLDRGIFKPTDAFEHDRSSGYDFSAIERSGATFPTLFVRQKSGER